MKRSPLKRAVMVQIRAPKWEHFQDWVNGEYDKPMRRVVADLKKQGFIVRVVKQNPVKRSRHIPRKVLEWGKKHLRSTKKTRADFRRIEAGATRRYGSKAAGRAVAGAARWKRLKARYAAAHVRRNPRAPSQYYVALHPSERGGLTFGLDRVTPVSWVIKRGRIPQRDRYAWVIPSSVTSKPEFSELASAAQGKSFYASYSRMIGIFKSIRDGEPVKVQID